jgi:hypothetical protein
MRPVPRGEPVHTRALAATLDLQDDGLVAVHGSLIDLRTRGFLPLGGSMQGMGIIHHMELRWVVDPATRVVSVFEPAQPTVAFEATPETAGESCRQPMAAVRALAGVRLGEGFARTLRASIGGALGCSHILTLALFLDGAVRAALDRDRAAFPPRWARPAAPGRIARRDVVFDGHEVESGRVDVVVRLGDLHWNAAPPTALAPERFWRYAEVAATVEVDLWPGELTAIAGGDRVRTADAFAGVAWQDRTVALAPLVGLGLARGAAGEIMRRLGAEPALAPWRDALLQLAPALVQCRAAHGDAWQEKVRATPRHPGLTAIPDSCWMWRRGGALERIREAHGAGKGGR